MKEEIVRKGWLDMKTVYGYYKCRVPDGDMEVLDEKGNALEKFNFSLSKYFLKEDIVAFQAVTAGNKINGAIKKLNEQKEVTRSFFLHGLSVHLAEALAAYLHDRVR